MTSIGKSTKINKNIEGKEECNDIKADIKEMRDKLVLLEHNFNRLVEHVNQGRHKVVSAPPPYVS
jgi:hypothetical protein